MELRAGASCAVDALTAPSFKPAAQSTEDISTSVTTNATNPRDLDISLKYTFEGKHGSADRSQAFKMR